MKRILFPVIFLLISGTNLFAQEDKFVPDDFKIPDTLENDLFRLRMLTVNDVVKDYDAVMSSIEHLQKQFQGWYWPSPDLSLEQDLIDLGWHQKEFQTRRSFAYTVVRPDESEVLGCVYILPEENRADIDAVLFMWVRSSVLNLGYDQKLFNVVKAWIKSEWPFRNVVYPNRE